MHRMHIFAGRLLFFSGNPPDHYTGIGYGAPPQTPPSVGRH